MDFDERIKVVIPMLEAKGLFGCASLIKDLKQSVDKCQNDSYNKAIDDFVTVILTKFTEAERNGNFRFYTSELKQSIADLGEQLKS